VPGTVLKEARRLAERAGGGRLAPDPTEARSFNLDEVTRKLSEQGKK
jgi:hypothetical protein